MAENKQLQSALRFLQRDPISNADLLDRLSHGLYRRITLAPDGVLLLDADSDVYLLSAETESSNKVLLEQARDDGCHILSYRGPIPIEAAISCMGFGGGNTSIQAVYTAKAPVPLSGRLTFSPLDLSYLDQVTTHYHLLPREEVAKHLQEGTLFGGFFQDKLAGFVGLHGEGSMGMLFVLPEYRRQGFARDLEGYLINRQLSAGHTPYAQVLLENAASMTLQRQMGLTFATRLIHWIHR